MRAYDESYLDDAMDALGGMLDYAVVDCGYDSDEFFEWFIVSGVATGFERGNPKFVAGMSGVELAREVRFRVAGERIDVPATQPLEKSPEYWAGWIMGYYQWFRVVRFEDMAAFGLFPSAVLVRYIYHEADVSKFVSFADAVMQQGLGSPTRLSRLRKERGMTQRDLAQAADVSLRMVQLYEQRQNDLSKAAASVVARLARTIGCGIEDLLA